MKIILILFAIITIINSFEFKTENGVLILNHENFDVAINYFEHVVVMFYAP